MAGGIDAWNGLVSRAEVDQGMYLIEGNEGPEEVISLAYGLEVGAYRFYRGLSEKSSDPETGDLFDT
jgi:rubrerythrin